MKDTSRSRGTDSTRRRILKGTGIAGAIAIFLPTSWTKPVLQAVVVPAHAQTTPGVTTTTATTATTATATTATATTVTATTATATTTTED